MIVSRRGVGQSNSDGYFQIEAISNDSLAFSATNGAHCEVSLGRLPKSDFARLGKVVCQ
jgi:hypothetical protein